MRVYTVLTVHTQDERDFSKRSHAIELPWLQSIYSDVNLQKWNLKKGYLWNYKPNKSLVEWKSVFGVNMDSAFMWSTIHNVVSYCSMKCRGKLKKSFDWTHSKWSTLQIINHLFCLILVRNFVFVFHSYSYYSDNSLLIR